MKKLFLCLALFLGINSWGQLPKLYIQIVSHNEPTENLQTTLNYTHAKEKVLQMAEIVSSHQAKWNLQTSDGFVIGARQDEINSGSNIFKTLGTAPYNQYIQIDPRNKNFSGRNIADQWYLLDSLGAHPSNTLGGFIYYICQPGTLTPDWWVYQDSITGLVHGNRIKFNLLSGAGSAGGSLMHCNDLYDFGVFKPDTIDNFYSHNSSRSVWCIGTGCAPLLDSLSDEQAIIDLIQGQVDSIAQGLWPANKFYNTRIMTNQREYGALFFSKIERIIDSLNQSSLGILEWATIGESFEAFQAWQQSSGKEYSMWNCGETSSTVIGESDLPESKFRVFPNPFSEQLNIQWEKSLNQSILEMYNAMGQKVYEANCSGKTQISFQQNQLPAGLYFIYLRSGDIMVDWSRVVLEK